ncbi:MAG: ATP synthase F1 subunit gamma [Candidatus Aminicenantes bacterium]|nr:ATP synthase F1 subunit gamma [Candidatus Aminicenantes bacterium]
MAGNLIFLRRRIKSVKNTQKLTKAMKTVSAAKLRRATSELKRSRPYRQKVEQLLRDAGRRADLAAVASQPLLTGNETGAVLLVVVAGDKGLCGAFNSNVLKNGEARCRELAAEGREIVLVTVGTKATRFFNKRKMAPRKAYNGMIGRLQFGDAERLAAELQALFLDEGLHSVEFAFSEYVSASTQRFALRRLFPLSWAGTPAPGMDAEAEDYIYEPGAAAVFQALLPRFVVAFVYQVLLQSVAAEQMARMVAMDLATRNASDMIRALTLQLNKMRQAAITKELLEIITATEALKQ